MFDAIIDKYVTQAKPVVLTAAQRMEWYAERIIDRLDGILEAVQSEEYEEVRRSYYVTLTADAEQELVQVPTGQTWQLEFLSVLTACSLTVTESGNFKLAKQFSGADILQPKILFQTGSVVHVITTGNATPTKVFLQFKVQRERKARPTRSAGNVVQPISGYTAQGEKEQLPRHFPGGDLHEGVNVRGERHA